MARDRERGRVASVADWHWPSLPAMFLAQAERHRDRPFLWAKHDGVYRAMPWGAVATQVTDLARGLRALDLKRGDRVGLVSENRPEWAIADLAIMSAGGVTVPAYTTHTIEDHRYLLANSGARAVIVSTAALAQRVLPAADQVDSVAQVVVMEEPAGGQVSAINILPFDQVLVRGREAGGDVAAWIGELRRDDLACLIYTSGTGGLPKGVMTSHGNILANCYGAFRLLEILGLEDEVFLNFLPLSHAYEHTAGLMFPISIGAAIYFAEGAETLAANLLEAKPTIMTAVPRLYETMHRRITLAAERKGRMARKMFDTAVAIGRKRAALTRPSLG